MSFRTGFLMLAVSIALSCGERPKPAKESPPSAAESRPLETKGLDGEVVAVIQTKEGDIVLRFYEADAPKTVAEFKRLAGKGFYNGTTFHRVIPNRLIQGGDPLSRDRDPYNDGTGNSGVFLPAEFNKHPFKPGTVGLARSMEKDSGSCQFFICLARNPQWDGEYTAFAEVVDGLEAARRISEAQTNPKHSVPQMRERPIRDQIIESIRIERRKVN